MAQTVYVEGMDDVRKVLKNVTPATKKAIESQFAWELDIMFKLSQVYVPKDTRALMASGRTIGPEDTLGGVEAGISYGGININPKTGETTNSYVVKVHEDLDMHHMPPTRAKFAEQAIIERLPALESRIARFVGTEVEARLMLQRAIG